LNAGHSDFTWLLSFLFDFVSHLLRTLFVRKHPELYNIRYYIMIIMHACHRSMMDRTYAKRGPPFDLTLSYDGYEKITRVHAYNLWEQVRVQIE